MHWIAWEKLTEAKQTGALGFRDLESFQHGPSKQTGVEANSKARPSNVKSHKKKILSKI